MFFFLKVAVVKKPKKMISQTDFETEKKIKKDSTNVN